MGLDFDVCYPGRFMKAGHLGGRDHTLLIKHIEIEELEGEKQKKEPKVIVTFGNAKRQLVLNKTNALCLKAMWGREVSAWVGKRVTLYAAPNPDSSRGFGDEICVRVRGSPDISAPMTFEIRPGRRKYSVTMTVTRIDPNGRTLQPGEKPMTGQQAKDLDALTQPAPQPNGKVTSYGPPPDDVQLPKPDASLEQLS